MFNQRFFLLLQVSWSSVVPLARDCVCGGAEHFLPYTFTSTAHIVEVHFNLQHMTSLEDHRGLHFLASWEFVRSPVCPRKQKVSGVSGELWFRSPTRTPDEVGLCKKFKSLRLFSGSLLYFTCNLASHSLSNCAQLRRVNRLHNYFQSTNEKITSRKLCLSNKILS